MRFICMGNNDIEYIDDGWYGIDKSPDGFLFRATKEKASIRNLNFNGICHLNLFLSARPDHSGQALTGKVTGTNGSGFDFELTNNQWVIRSGEISIKKDEPFMIKVDNPWSPDQLYQNGDARSLGVMICAISISQHKTNPEKSFIHQ